MELDEEYPKTCRKRARQINSLLQRVSDLGGREREELALSLDQMADKARDLDEIMDRLLNEPHTPAEIAELFIALELTTEQIRGHSDYVDGKLYDIADRLKAESPTEGASNE